MQELLKGDEGAFYYSPEYCVPLLDYVEILAEEYNPLAPGDMECGYLVTKGIGTFLYRYFDDKIDKSFKQKFIDDKEVQKTITAFGYDVDKFWYLLLFVYDFSSGMCKNGIVMQESPKDQIQKLPNAIVENVRSYSEDGSEITFKSPTKIILDIKGKHKITIVDPITILSLAKMCLDGLDNIEVGSLLSQSNTKIKINNGKIVGESKSNSVHIWYFAKMLLKFFALEPPKKVRQKKGSTISYGKKLFISRLIYITGLSANKNLLDSDDTLKGYLAQYKFCKLDMINSMYW